MDFTMEKRKVLYTSTKTEIVHYTVIDIPQYAACWKHLIVIAAIVLKLSYQYPNVIKRTETNGSIGKAFIYN